MTRSIVRVASWAYAAMLRAYPRRFRARFADQMASDFEAQCIDALDERGRVALAGWMCHAMADLAWNASIARVRDATPAARGIIRVLRPHPGFAALGVVVSVAPTVLLGKALASRQPLFASYATVYAWIMMLAVSVASGRADGSAIAEWSSVRSVTRVAAAFTTLGLGLCWIARPSAGAVLSLDFRPFLLATLTVALATAFAALSRFLRLR